MIFGPQGMVALMFLKTYVECSDEMLINHLNGNIDFQIFCGILLGAERIKNFKIVSDIRCRLARNLDVREVQGVLAGYWKAYLRDPNVMLEDATCYETSIRYPTNVKLTELNEIPWIFFGVHTANAVRIAKRLAVSRVEQMAS